MPENLFSEYYDEPTVDIPDNDFLARLCNQILRLKEQYPNLFMGDTMAEINRKVMLAVWLDNGLRQQIPHEHLKPLVDWMKNTKVAMSEENTSRAVRYLAAKGKIPLPSKAVQVAERHRQRIARSIKG